MSCSRVVTVVVACLISVGESVAAPGAKVWFVDSLVKVFATDTPRQNRLAKPEYWGARNQHVSIQVAIRSSKPLSGVTAEVGTLEGAGGGKIADVRIQHAGYVAVASHTPDTPPGELVGEAPGWYPDPLVDLPFELEANRTHALWITVHVPGNAAPGLYRGTVAVLAAGRRIAHRRFRLTVLAARVPEERSLKVTNWFLYSAKTAQQFYKVGAFSPEGWKLLENIARVMADHRQNVIITPLLELVQARAEGSELRYDFTNFDRWVETFRKAGVIGYIEGSHLVGRAGGYDAALQVTTLQVVEGKVRREALAADDPRVEPFLASFLTALNAHLEEEGWKNIYYQHILDEAHGKELPYYAKVAEIVRRHLPGVLTIDAVDAEHMPEELQKNCDIWVPILGAFDDETEMIARRIQGGREVWFYTCLYPQQRYMNRLLDYPLIKVRLLHWLNFRHNLAGYLHWGWNWWTPEPMLATQPIINQNKTLLPAGDAFIVYPDRANLSVRTSIRLEMMREGIEDYELLRLLEQKNPAEAERIVKAAITSFTEYVRDPAAFRRLERSLLEALSN